MGSIPKHSSADRDSISRMLGSAAVGPLPHRVATDEPKRPASEVVPRVAARSSPRGEPDFSRMTPAEKVAWNLARWKRVLG